MGYLTHKCNENLENFAIKKITLFLHQLKPTGKQALQKGHLMFPTKAADTVCHKQQTHYELIE